MISDNISNVPIIGWNVTKTAKSVRVCCTRNCDKPVFVSKINAETGEATYMCSEHGVRNRGNMTWFEFATTATFQEKVGK